ncbi:MAG: response regulator [Anaerolineales bacterium]
MRILYIEDDDANIALVSRVINMSGDDLSTYRSAEDALEHADLRSYDVILTDVHLGDHAMDGLDFTEVLRRQGIQIPIIAISAFDVDEFEKRSADVGSDLYIVKPIAPQDLMNILDDIRNQITS